MRHLHQGHKALFALMTAVALAATWSAVPAQAQSGPVSATPASGTPQLYADGNVDQVRQLVQCGGTMYAVGTFTEIQKGSTVYARNNVFSFSATAPFAVTSWAPDVNGIVNSIALSPDCSEAYLGGTFSSVNGTSVTDIAEVSTSTGALNTAFPHSANGQVDTLLVYGTHLLAGGYFTKINGSTADPYFTSLNTTTGKDDGFLQLAISGNYQFSGVASNPTRVYNQALSHGGTLDLVMGDFTSVGGLPRQQIFMLNLATSPASVTGWTSPEWDGSQGEATPTDPTNGYPYQCATVEPFYIQAAAWSPDDSTIYIADTGYHPNNWPTGETPRNGLCDAAAAFPSTQTSVLHEWVNYTGCDSMFAVAADAYLVYVGGHERWANNPDDCDAQGPGAIPAPGMAGLSPTTGLLYTNSAGTAGYYSRARGLGADDMLLTSAGLWIASDNEDNGTQCGGLYEHSGICLLPYTN
jgi:hypothetical protein